MLLYKLASSSPSPSFRRRAPPRRLVFSRLRLRATTSASVVSSPLSHPLSSRLLSSSLSLCRLVSFLSAIRHRLGRYLRAGWGRATAANGEPRGARPLPPATTLPAPCPVPHPLQPRARPLSSVMARRKRSGARSSSRNRKESKGIERNRKEAKEAHGAQRFARLRGPGFEPRSLWPFVVSLPVTPPCSLPLLWFISSLHVVVMSTAAHRVPLVPVLFSGSGECPGVEPQGLPLKSQGTRLFRRKTKDRGGRVRTCQGIPTRD